MKAVGIDEVVIFCVNDGAVMDAWAEDQGVAKSPMIGEPRALRVAPTAFTETSSSPP